MKNIINTLSGLSLSGLRDVFSQLFEFFNATICCCIYDDRCAEEACCLHAEACCCDCCCC